MKKHRSLFVGILSVSSVIGISIAATSPFLTKTINYYVSNENINIGNKNSLFFVTDGGDIRDGSFNESAYHEVSAITNKYNYEAPPNSNYSTLLHSYNLAVSRGASIIELNGFLHTQALKEFSREHPNIGVIFLDSSLSIKNLDTGKTQQQGNVASITFLTQQVGFLAGYAAAAWASKHHKRSGYPIVSGVGGEAIPPVVMYLAGFQQGITKFNSTLPSNKPWVRLYLKDVLHWKKGKYFGGFSADPQSQVTNFTKQAINAGVDVIFPVGGPQAFTVIRTLKNQNVSPNTMKVIGVDADLTNQTYPGLPKDGKWTKYILASATKAIANSIASLSSSIFDIPIQNPSNSKKSLMPGVNTNNKKETNVFGHVYKGSLTNNWMLLTGQYKNGKSQTAPALYKELGISASFYKNTILPWARKATPKTDFYTEANN